MLRIREDNVLEFKVVYWNSGTSILISRVLKSMSSIWNSSH
jgi:hypothetical protein